MLIDPIIRKWANVFLKLDRMVEGSPNTKTASNKIMRALEASTPDARSVAGWYSAYRAGRVSLRDAATALYREGAALSVGQSSNIKHAAIKIDQRTRYGEALRSIQYEFIAEVGSILVILFKKEGFLPRDIHINRLLYSFSIEGQSKSGDISALVVWTNEEPFKVDIRLKTETYSTSTSRTIDVQNTPASVAQNIWDALSKL